MPKDAEERISRGVLRIAASRSNGVATFKRCRAEIPSIVNLTQADTAPSTTRRGEQMWHQIVRNIKSHYKEESNYLRLGYLEHVPKVGYRITDAGRLKLEKKG